MHNPLIISIFPALVLGVANGIYWQRQGYKGWHLYYLGILAFYALSVIILQKIY